MNAMNAMKLHSRWRTLAFALLAALTGAVLAEPTLSNVGKAALTQYAGEAVARGAVAGVVTLVVNRDGVVYAGVAGKQDVARTVEMSVDTIFRIASMTKPITSVAIMMLAEEGKLALDDPVAKFLPQFDKWPVIARFDATHAIYTARPAARALTLRHLLTHTAGFGYAFSDPTLARIASATRRPEADVPLLHDPGAQWTYGVNTQVLGWVVEKVSGQRLDTFLRTRIFEPLKMADTAHIVPPQKLSRVATVHLRVNGQLRERPNEARQESTVRGDAGLYSTARDYGQFLRMLLNGGTLGGVKVLSPQSVKLMGENHIGALYVQTQPTANPQLAKPFPLGADQDKFGLGFQIQANDPSTATYRSPGSLSWAGIHNTHFWLDPKREIAAVVLMQVLPFYDDEAIRVLRGIEQVVYRHLM